MSDLAGFDFGILDKPVSSALTEPPAGSIEVPANILAKAGKNPTRTLGRSLAARRRHDSSVPLAVFRQIAGKVYLVPAIEQTTRKGKTVLVPKV